MSSIALSILVKVTLTTLLALGGVRLARRSRAAVRHVLLATAFAMLLVVPVLSVLVPPVPVVVPIAATAPASPLDHQPIAEASATPAAEEAIVSATSRRLSVPAGTLLIAAWIGGMALSLLPVAAGLWQVRRLRRAALPWRRGQAVVTPLALDARIRRPIDVLLHQSVPGPMTCGLAHPAIVLPIEAQTWSEEDLNRAIVHELEHVRRGDWMTHCFARAISAAYWFHPLVWIAWRQLGLEAERACDDAVLRRAEATAYADQLVGLAARLATGAKAPLLAMASRSDLASRVLSVLDTRQARGRAGLAAVALTSLVAAALVTTISPLRIVASAAGKAAQVAGDKQEFAIVSIRPCEGEPLTPPGQRSSQGGFPTVSPGRFFIDCGTVERLISNAYVLNGEALTNQQARIGDIEWLKNVPGWLRSEKFTIEAKAEGTPDRKVMLGPMLRALLEDRFKLKIHRESDQRPVYVMTVAKGGLKIAPDTCTEMDPNGPPPGRDYMAALAAGAKPTCGVMNMAGTPGRNRWTIGGSTMEHFAGTLSTTMDYFVIDKTGVDGSFNIHLEFAPDEHVPGSDKRYGPRTSFPEPDGPTIFKALEEQLGLRLDLTKGAHGFLVIDRIERPALNGGAKPPSATDIPSRAGGAGVRAGR